MKFVKWALIFAFIFCLSLVLIKTISQDTFNLPAQAWLFGYDVPQLPVYYYVVIAFIIGLSIGAFMAVYYYIAFNADNFKKTKRVKHLEKEAEILNNEIKIHKQSISKLENDIVQEKSKALYKPTVNAAPAQPAQQMPQPKQMIPPAQQPIQQQQPPNIQQARQAMAQPPAQEKNNIPPAPSQPTTSNGEFSLEDFLEN